MKLNQSFLRASAAILILIYHVWAFITTSNVEYAIIKASFVGVDIFFFLSAFSMANKKIDYKSFVFTRFIKLYLKFIFFVIVIAIYKSWDFIKILKTISFISFFEIGGGSFLWFTPAILIFYLLFPLFHIWNNKYKWLYVLIGWLILGVTLTYLTSYSALFIFINRIPVILLGYYCKKIKIPSNIFVGIGTTIVGIALLYFFGYKYRIQDPIYDFYYVFALPFVFGLAMLSGYVKELKVNRMISNCSFELYGLQMIFGFDLVNELLFVIDPIIICDLLTIIILLVSAFILSLLFKYIDLGINKLMIKSSKNAVGV